MSFEKTKDAEIIAKGGGFVDVTSCGSSVLYYVTNENDYHGSRFSGNMQLTDCNRMITWSFECDNDGIKKLDTTIEYFLEMRIALLKGKKLNAKKDKEKEKEKKEKKE